MLRRKGVDVISLAMGESGFSTPEWISDAACRAVAPGQTRYTEMTGTFGLKEAVRRKYERENDLEYDVDEIIISSGATQALSNAMRATLRPGDEVLLLVPYWSPYSGMILAQGGVPVCVPTSAAAGGAPISELEAAISPRTRWLFLNSPCNPSGVVLSPDDLGALAALLRRHPDILIISDDIYEKTVFEGSPKNIVNVAPDLRDRTVIVNGVSKSYAMTG
jgi:aspartate aminotransferase